MASANAHKPEQIIAQSIDNDDDELDETTSFLHLSNISSSNSANSASKMASEDNPKQKKHKEHHHHATDTLSTFNQHMITGAHACILLFVILIIYFCFAGDFQFFTWHPLLLAIGWMFLMTEASLALSKDNLFTGTLPKKIKVRLHWIFLCIALVLILAGFAVVYINKNNLNKSHFKSWHGLFGLIGVICAIPTALNGILALYHGDLRHYISPRLNKFVHIGSAVLTIIFGGLALILSVYTKWFARQSDNNIITFVLGLVLATYPITWTLVRPIKTCVNHIKRFMKKTE